MTTQPTSSGVPDDPLWYQDAIIYELHIRAFKDSNGDGVGDILGLIEKLDYLVDLGVTAIWLLPFYPSPLKDGGYDIAEYTGVHADYGTREDVALLLDEAHRRGLRVITELVLNHTSSEHQWFQRARRAPPGSPEREFYVWSDTPRRYEDTRIIFQDFETSNWSWDPVAGAYYWHRFYSHQPDLNFDNPAVHEALFRVIDFWFDLGVDGMRLDAVPYLYEREGTSCENLPETHEFLRKLRAHVDGKYKNRMLLAEANQWPADAAAYFGTGDECHMNFHFPLMPRMFIAVEQEDSFPIINILKRTPQIPANCQWATFLRNHDELTLEMVTDEDRDAMWRAYAAERHARINLGIRRRLAPLLTVRRKVELLNALLLSLPGTPVLYYGDEIGMGDNIFLGDRDGVRTPMQWSGDRNAGFSRCNPQRLYLPAIIDPEFHFEAVNVEAQQANPSSLLWWMKRLIAKRKEHRAFGRGTITFVTSDNPRVLAFYREHDGDRVLVVANLSRFVQCARLDLSAVRGVTPVEVFGRMPFPEVADGPWFVSLGPHGFYWLSLAVHEDLGVAARPAITVTGDWSAMLGRERRAELARALLWYVRQRRWFRGKSRQLKAARVADVIRMGDAFAFVLLSIEYDLGIGEQYALPIGFKLEPPDHSHLPASCLIAAVTISDVPSGGDQPLVGTLYDAVHSDAFGGLLLELMRTGGTLTGENGAVAAVAAESLHGDGGEPLPQRMLSAEQTNTSIVYGNRWMLKLFRVIAGGPSSELEIGRLLTARGYPAAPRFVGALEYHERGQEPSTLSVTFDYVPNQSDAWQLTLDALDLYFDRMLSDTDRPPAPAVAGSLLERASQPPSEQVRLWVGPYLERMHLLGLRTAELHKALGAASEDPMFAPQPFDIMHQQSIHQSASAAMSRVFERLRKRMAALSESAQAMAQALMGREHEVEVRLSRIAARRMAGYRIRTHGDLHLGQVLWTGDDFVFIDFEGEPARPVSQRRFKRSPLRDAAGMLRSFHYASQAALREGRVRPEDLAHAEPWAASWSRWVAAAYLSGYLAGMEGSSLITGSPGDLAMMLDFYLFEKCIYEVGYELDNRPDWLEIPMAGMLSLLDGSS